MVRSLEPYHELSGFSESGYIIGGAQTSGRTVER